MTTSNATILSAARLRYTSLDNAKAIAYTAYRTAVVKADEEFAIGNRISADLYARAAALRTAAIQVQHAAYDLANTDYANAIEMASK